MKFPTKKGALAAASLAYLTVSSNAQIIFTDTFNSGTGAWYRASTATSAGVLSNDAGQLSFQRNGDAMREIIGRSFTTTTLGVGETIRLTFDYTQTSASAVIFRAGLHNVTTPIAADNWANSNAVGAWSGYYTFVRDNSATGNTPRANSGASTSSSAGPTIGGTTITGTTYTQYDMVQDGTLTYQGVFEVTRTSSTQMDTLFTLSSGATTHFSVSGSTSIVQDDFNMAVLRIAGGTALFDNVQVEVIPEASTGAPIQLVITPNGPNYDFEWNSQPGKVYDLLTSTDLASPIAEWTVYDPDGPGGDAPLGDILPSGGATTLLTNVPSSEPRRFFAIREKN